MKRKITCTRIRHVAAVAAVTGIITMGVASGQVLDNPGFAALPRPINYATPLAPANGPKALIVYGQEAPWTREAAAALQKAVQDWAGVRLDLADDRTVTDEETWLLNDAYLKTPMIVLGNAQDNRVMHALGTRYLLQSNRTWPGGDRYVIRAVFEPFTADVNYVVLEASGPAGMDAATAKFIELLKTLPAEAKAMAVIPPRLRVLGGVTNKWHHYEWPAAWWRPPLPPEMTSDPRRSVSEMARMYKDKPPRAGWGITRESSFPNVWAYILGGEQWPRGQDWRTLDLDEGTLKAVAAMCLLGCRAAGGRAYPAMDHYGAATFLVWLRALFQTGLLTEAELNEIESAIVLSACEPNDYVLNHIGNGDGIVGGIWSGRHSTACLITAVQELNYILTHCRLDERTRREAQRRYDGARKSVTSYIRSFRGNHDDSCLGEDTVLQFYALLQEGFMENVRNGMLRHSADFYIMTSDNIPDQYIPDPYNNTCYAGLSGFSSGNGGESRTWEGGSLIVAAAFYYDDPQYRWFVRNRNLYLGSEAAYPYGMHSPYDAVGAVEPPTRYLGVRALPVDERIYGVLVNPRTPGRMEVALRGPPDRLDTAIDRVSFRDGFAGQDAYLYLATSQDMYREYPAQNNSIARYTDLGDIWLYANTYDGTTWSRSVVNTSNGGSYIPRAACQLEALANLKDVSMVSSMEPDAGGADWTRTIVHWRGHYFVVLDHMQARQDGDYSFVCRWRALPTGTLADGVWTVTAAGGNTLRIQSAEDLRQTAEIWPCDGSAEPSILQQYKQAKLKKGEAQTYQNLLYVSGEQRPDEFQVRQAGPRSVMVRGRTKDGEHTALVGAGGNIPLDGFQTDAAIYHVTGQQLCLAGLTTLTAKTGGAPQEIFWSREPVNALLDCQTGQAEIEVTGTRAVPAKTGQHWVMLKPGRQTALLAQGDALPKPKPMLEALWAACRAPAGQPPPPPDAGAAVFDARAAAAPLQKPLLRLTDAVLTPTPGPNGVNHDGRIWNSTDNLEFLFTFPKPARVACLRLVGSTATAYGRPYAANDFKFSLVLSEDNFQKDIRKIEAPDVTFEETPRMVAGHFVMTRYPTWRIDMGTASTGPVRQIKLLPRATTKERPNLVMFGIEVYGAERVNQLQAKAFAADINGDGANELVTGTSQRQVAAYAADGTLLWSKIYPAEIHALDVADLDEDGKTEVLAYLTTEKLHRINGDGTERPIGDVNTVCTRGVNIISIGAWGPDGPTNQEVVLWSGEPSSFRVLADGTVKPLKSYAPQASLRLTDFWPDEPEALATLASWELAVWSPKRGEDGGYTRLGSKRVTGSNSGNEASPPGVLRQFCRLLAVEARNAKWLVGAVASGLNVFPLAAFAKNAPEEGWQYNTGGPSGAALLVHDLDGDGAPEILYARQDGFVNVFRLADGYEVGRLSTGGPIVGMCLLKNRAGKLFIAVGTKFGVALFGTDLQRIGAWMPPVPLTAFAGPGGKAHDCAYAVDSAGQVMVLVLK